LIAAGSPWYLEEIFMVDVVCYYRHSTDNAQQDANSIPRQRDNCRGLVVRNGWRMIEEVEDKGLSGTGDKRNLSLLAQRTRNNEISFDVLLVDDQSRLTRKNVMRILEDVGWLEEQKIKVAFVKADNGKPITIDEWASDPAKLIQGWSNNQTALTAADLSVDGLMNKHQRGHLSWAAKAPFGFDKVEAPLPEGAKDNGKPYMVLRPNEDFPFVENIFKGFLSGSSIRGLVPELEKAPSYDNKVGNWTTIKGILKNPIYCGYWAYGVRNVGKMRVMNERTKRFNLNGNSLEDAASVVEYDVEHAVTKSDFLSVQTILESERSKSRGAYSSQNYRYTSLCKCSFCGGAMIARCRPEGAGGALHTTYFCGASNEKGKKCRDNPKPFAKSFTEKEMDELLQNYFGEEVSHNVSFHWSLIETVAEDIVSSSNSSKSSYQEELAKLDIEEMDIQKAYQQFRKVPDWMIGEQDRITQRRSELDQLLKQGATLSTLVQQQKDDWIAGSGSQGGHYLSIIWNIAEQYAKDELDWPNSKKAEVADQIVSVWLNSLKAGDKVKFFVKDDPDKDSGESVIAGFTFNDPDVVLDVLKSMGLESIKVAWKHGEKRGKAKWLVDGVELNFLWPDSATGLNRTLAGYCDTSSQKPTFNFS